MRVQVTCGSCGTSYSFPAANRRGAFRCKTCSSRVDIGDAVPIAGYHVLAGSTNSTAHKCRNCGASYSSGEGCGYCGASFVSPPASRHAHIGPDERAPSLRDPTPEQLRRRTAVGAIAALGGLAAVVVAVLDRRGGELELALLGSVLVAAAGLAWLAAKRPWLAVWSGGLAGLVLLLKPFVWPVQHGRFSGVEMRAFSLTSETHLYYLLPGGALLLLAVIVGIGLPRRKK